MAVLKSKKLAAVVAAMALAFPVCFSLLTPYMAEGHDTFEYLVRQIEFHENIAHGIVFPQWAPDLVHGNGEPLFVFNPPMIYYVVEFWHLLGFNFVVAISLACTSLVLASEAGMYLLGRLYFGTWGGWIAAAAYLYAPYFAVNLYVRGALAEFAAFPFFAFALYGFGAYARSGKYSHWVIGTASYAGVLLSHNAAALFFTPLLLAFFALASYIQRSWRILAKQSIGLVLGLGLGACVWMPALAERPDVRLYRILEGYLRYSNHFVSPRQLIYSAWGYGLSIAGYQDQLSFSVGWTHLLLILAVLIVAAKRRNVVDWRWLWFFGMATLVYCVMMTPASTWIWDRVLLLQYVEFPWRMLGPVCVCVAMLLAPLGALLETSSRYRSLLLASVLALLIAPNVLHNRPEKYHVYDLAELTPEKLARNGHEPSTAFEYGPRWVRVWPLYNPQGFRVVQGSAEVQNIRRSVNWWEADYHADQPAELELSITYFPGWSVFVDHLPVTAWPAAPTGLIHLELPPGAHTVRAFFKRTPIRAFGQGVTVASMAILVVVGAVNIRRRRAYMN